LNTRLLGAAVLIALAVLFVPMFFSGKPPAEGGDTAVNLAIPPAPDRDLQTRTMDLSTAGSTAALDAATVAAAAQAPASSDQLATVNIGSNRPLDVENDPRAGKPHEATTITTGTGVATTEPVIPMQAPETRTPPPASKPAAAPAPAPAAPAPKADKPVAAPAPKPAPVAPAPAPAPAVAASGDSYMLNLSAYASASGAARLQQQVRALGYPVSGHAITQAGQPRTKVVAGPFATRAAAEAARLKITQTIAGVPATLERGSAPAGKSSAPAASTSRAGGFAVQLAAVSNRADADALRDKLRAQGFDGFVDSVQSGGKQLWRVRAGPQTQRADAQRVHDQIKARLGIDGNIVTVP